MACRRPPSLPVRCCSVVSVASCSALTVSFCGRDPEPFDWYQRYSGIADLLNKYVKKDDNVLVAGAGNSRLSEDMYEDGYQTLTNVDISRVVVDQMIEKYKDKSALTYQQMNVCSLEFPDESFDAVVAKGLMDAILCGEGSTANVAKMCQEVSRVLKPVSTLPA